LKPTKLLLGKKMNAAEKFAFIEKKAEELLKSITVDKSPLNFCHYKITQYLNPQFSNSSLWACGWRFKWNRGKRLVGLCSYKDKTIQVSSLFVNNNENVEEFIDTLLHEIAHALTPGEKHGHLWKVACRTIGANPSRICNNPLVVGTNNHLAKWVAKCETCGYTHVRHRRPKYMGNIFCAATNECQRLKNYLKWEKN
jgi:hypothetical protein